MVYLHLSVSIVKTQRIIIKMISFILDSTGNSHKVTAIPQNGRGYIVLLLKKDIWTILEVHEIKQALNALKISDDLRSHEVADIAKSQKIAYIKMLELNLTAKKMGES